MNVTAALKRLEKMKIMNRIVNTGSNAVHYDELELILQALAEPEKRNSPQDYELLNLKSERGQLLKSNAYLSERMVELEKQLKFSNEALEKYNMDCKNYVFTLAVDYAEGMVRCNSPLTKEQIALLHDFISTKF